MSKYASLLFSPERYHEVGPFRFPVYNDLVPGEAKQIEAISKKQSKSTYKSIKLAQKIAKDLEITTKEAFELLSKGVGENEDLLYTYASEFEEIQSETVGAVEQQVAFVTVFMRYRGEVKLPRAKDWQKLSDWTEEDTEQIPTKILDDIFRLITWERDGWPDPEAELGNDQIPEKATTPVLIDS